MRVWYITRSYLPMLSGGTLVRAAQVDSLARSGYSVKVVTPSYQKCETKPSGITVHVPASASRLKLGSWMERLGLVEDYLDSWVEQTYEILLQRVQKTDLVFSTSGGELGCIKLGSRIKEALGCRHVVNFHDPLDYSIVNGLKIDRRFHVSRETQEEKYLRSADLIIASSKVNQSSLQRKYPHFANRVVSSYFGYVEEVGVTPRVESTQLRVAYGGNYSSLQSPELLAELVSDVAGAEAIFIGEFGRYRPLKEFYGHRRCRFVNALPYREFLAFMSTNVDVGFVSLTSDYLAACVPSKIYEYVNLGLPILGAMAQGDASDIINSHGFGQAFDYRDVPSLKAALVSMVSDRTIVDTYRANVLRERSAWAMRERMKEVVSWLSLS